MKSEQQIREAIQGWSDARDTAEKMDNREAFVEADGIVEALEWVIGIDPGDIFDDAVTQFKMIRRGDFSFMTPEEG